MTTHTRLLKLPHTPYLLSFQFAPCFKSFRCSFLVLLACF